MDVFPIHLELSVYAQLWLPIFIAAMLAAILSLAIVMLDAADEIEIDTAAMVGAVGLGCVAIAALVFLIRADQWNTEPLNRALDVSDKAIAAEWGDGRDERGDVNDWLFEACGSASWSDAKPAVPAHVELHTDDGITELDLVAYRDGDGQCVIEQGDRR